MIIIDKLMIYLLCVLLSVKEYGEDVTILLALIFLSLTCFCMEIEQEKRKKAFLMLYLVCFFIYYPSLIFVPLFLYDWLESKNKWLLFCCFFTCFFHLRQVYLSMELFINVLLTIYLFNKTKDLNFSKKQKDNLRDQEVEKQILLKKENDVLYNQVENQIQVAILTERNRIAREIHDHVGHMLSSCILQAGALSTVVKREEEKILLKQLKNTLDEAMNQIRFSVHNIFDESLDLESELKKIIVLLKNFNVDFSYDASKYIEKNIKFCVLSVVKEATNNIVKYSDGDKVAIQFREHPAFYQLVISDNGTSKVRNLNGIGINSMSERIEKMQGNFRINDEKGFEVFATIPKLIGNKK